MTLSSKQIGDIANLYESITASGQEQLNEGAADVGAGIRKAVGGAVGGAVRTASDIGGSALKGLVGQKTISSNPISRAANTYTRIQTAPVRVAGDFAKGLVTGQGDKAAPSKYKSSSDGKMYKNYNDALAAHNSRIKSGTGSAAPSAPGSGSRPAANGTSGSPKVLPTKPAGPAKPAGSPMQQWAAAHPDLAAKVKPGQSGYGDIQKQRNTASLSAPKAPASSTLGQAVSAASKPSPFSPAPATTSQATAAAPSTSPAASGSVVSATNKVAAMKQQPQVKPLAASYEYEDAYDLVLEYLFDNGHVDTLDEAHYVMMELDAEVIQNIVEETLTEKLAKGTKGVSFATGRHQGGFDQAMTERNPSTGRQRKTSPMHKAMGAHSKAKAAQWEAERKGDTESARRHETRRNKIANTVYNKTNRIIDRADND